eukprot:gene4272-4578_t
MLVDLPDIIYILFKSFLSDEDFVQLVSSSQRYFKEIRRENIYFLLNHSKSKRFCVDESYRDYILSRVNRPDRQISMSLPINMVQKYKDLLTVNRLLVGGNKDHTSDHSIPILPVKSLYLLALTKIQNINSLSQLEKLYIYKCHEIADISALKDVKDIMISWNHNIRDFSCFGKQETLRFSGYSCNIADVSMMNKAWSVQLKDLSHLKDVSSLANVKELKIINCKEIEDISMLDKVRALHLSILPAVRKYDCLEQHPNLTISCYKGQGNMDILTKLRGAVKNLYLNRTDFSVFVHLPSFSRLMLLSISDNDEELELQGCEDIHTIQLHYCTKITTTKGLGRNREVDILLCDELIVVSHLANVPIVTISYCSKLIDVSCLSNVPRLKVSSCGEESKPL